MYIWGIYFFILSIIPAGNRLGNIELSILLLFIFVILSSLTYMSLCGVFKGKVEGIHDKTVLTQWVNLTVILTLVGVLCTCYDRLYIQNIDYSKGLAFAREQWRLVGEARQGVSSIYSVLGNLLSGFPVVLMAIAYYAYEELSIRERLVSMFVSLSSMLVLVVLSGGRSILMMFALTFLLVGLLRLQQGETFLPIGLVFFSKVGMFLLGFVFLLYTGFVFHIRAVTGGDTPASYRHETLEHLGGIDYLTPVVDGDTFLMVTDYLTLIGAYIVHSAWTFASVLSTQPSELVGNVTLNFYRIGYAKLLGEALTDPETIFSGLFYSLPGSFYYDFGSLGFVLAAMVVGLLLFIAAIIARRKVLTPFTFAIYIASMYIVVLSPLLLAVDIMSFPFIVFDFLMLHLFFTVSRLRIIER